MPSLLALFTNLLEGRCSRKFGCRSSPMFTVLKRRRPTPPLVSAWPPLSPLFATTPAPQRVRL
jgi:hypothetical protein